MWKWLFSRNQVIQEAPVRSQRIPEPFPSGLTLARWAENPILVQQTQALYQTELMRQIFGVLYNSLPSGYPLRGQLINDQTCALELGRIEGYLDCLAVLKSLALVKVNDEEIPMTFDPVAQE